MYAYMYTFIYIYIYIDIYTDISILNTSVTKAKKMDRKSKNFVFDILGPTNWP